MSWLEKINTDYTITCGDGASYTPSWLNANKSVEYNVATFEFIEMTGSYVNRRLPKGRRFNIEIYFQGEDHLDVSSAFEQSAGNPGAWTIQHPLYGNLLVQPAGLTFDDASANVTLITAAVTETITEDAPRVTLSPADKILEDKATTDELLAETYVQDVIPKSVDVQDMKSNAGKVYSIGAKTVTSTLDSEAYFNAFNRANSLINNAISEPLAAIRELQAMINLPSQFADTIKNRLNTLRNQLETLFTSIDSLARRGAKKLYENNGGTIIGAMAAGSVTNVTYKSRVEALSVIDIIIGNYNLYLANLDLLQTVNGGTVDSYIPDAGSLISLSNLVSYTVSALLELAAKSRQERTIYLSEDSNIILVAFRIYGLLPDDSTISELMETNDIGLNEILILRKGRKITYYV